MNIYSHIQRLSCAVGRIPCRAPQKGLLNLGNSALRSNRRFLLLSRCFNGPEAEGVKNENNSRDKTTEQDLSADLIKSVLALEEIDLDLYRGTNLWSLLGGRGAYGGQVVGQALAAAGMTKPEDAHVHSLHCYFVRTGNTDVPILYHVDRIRDGRSFCTRTVNATQKSKSIMTMGVSFHKPEEGVLDFQYKMPDVPPPEKVPTLEELLHKQLKLDNLSESRRGVLTKLLAAELPVIVKPLNSAAFIRIGQPVDPHLFYWVKVKGRIGDNENLHHCVAAYISDLSLLPTALVPFPEFRVKMLASLDHSMWFHSPFKTDEWMLYECECPRSVNTRCFIQGRFWRQDGVLAVTVAQEGVIRGHIPEGMPGKS